MCDAVSLLKTLHIYICLSKIIPSVAEKKQKYLLEKISERENEQLRQFLAARRWKCARPIKYAYPNRLAGALFINSQYLPGWIHEYSWTDVPDTHTTSVVVKSVHLFLNRMCQVHVLISSENAALFVIMRHMWNNISKGGAEYSIFSCCCYCKTKSMCIKSDVKWFGLLNKSVAVIFISEWVHILASFI